MRQIKVKGIVIKETPYKDNDKIITILTDSIGKISCMAKGAKKNNSPILACSQYLVYSEFILYKSNNFYYINSAEIVSTFYNFRVDFEKLEEAFELTKLLSIVVSENEDTSDILNLFLNTIYLLDKDIKDKTLVKSIFKLKLFCLIGFSPNFYRCNGCGQAFLKEDKIYYDYVSNAFICSNCYLVENKSRYININYSTLLAIKFVSLSNIKKVFSFEITAINNFEIFVNTYQDVLLNDI